MLAETAATPKRARHQWTDADRDLVRRFYHGVETAQLAERIGVTPRALTQKALILGLGHPKAKAHTWTEDEDQILRRDFRQTHASRDDLAHRLGVTSGQVSHRIGILGLAKPSERRRWTPEEDARLDQLMDQGKTCASIAKAMNRSANSVKLRASRYLARHISDRFGWYTKNDVCQILGVNHRWVQARIDSGALAARPHIDGDIPQKAGTHAWHITDRNLADFIRTYPEELNGRNVDMVAIISLFAPIQDRPSDEYLNIGAITRYQAMGWTYRQIADHFGKQPSAVASHVRRAGKQRRSQERFRPEHCRKGHELSGDNVRVTPATGRWYCRTCSYIRGWHRRGQQGAPEREPSNV
jgi:DNA-binding CsgD family transcriptional regulator